MTEYLDLLKMDLNLTVWPLRARPTTMSAASIFSKMLKIMFLRFSAPSRVLEKMFTSVSGRQATSASVSTTSAMLFPLRLIAVYTTKLCRKRPTPSSRLYSFSSAGNASPAISRSTALITALASRSWNFSRRQ